LYYPPIYALFCPEKFALSSKYLTNISHNSWDVE